MISSIKAWQRMFCRDGRDLGCIFAIVHGLRGEFLGHTEDGFSACIALRTKRVYYYTLALVATYIMNFTHC